MIVGESVEMAALLIPAVTRKRRKKIEYNPRAKNESVQAFLSLQPGQRITIEFESIAADEGDSLTAAVSLCDHFHRQVYSERLLKVVSINADV